MNIQGEMIIGRQAVRGSAGTLRAYNPSTRAEMEPEFGAASMDEIARRANVEGQPVDQRALVRQQLLPDQRIEIPGRIPLRGRLAE